MCVPKVRFCNIDDEDHRGQAVVALSGFNQPFLDRKELLAGTKQLIEQFIGAGLSLDAVIWSDATRLGLQYWPNARYPPPLVAAVGEKRR
jgi:hypothetical protein